MGREKIITPTLNEIHQRFGTPYKSILVTGGLIVVFLLFGNLELLATAGSVLHLIVYGLLNVALIVMREADPAGYDPDYEVPLYPIVPLVGAVLSFALIVYIEPLVIALSAGLVAFAGLWYLFYARSRVENTGVLANWVLDRSGELPDVAVSAATTVQPEGNDYRVMVPLANPAHQQDLIALASAIAKHRDGTVVAVHIEQVPDQTSLAAAREQGDYEAAHHLLNQAKEEADTRGVEVETHTVLSHRSFEEIFDAATRFGADLTIVGWGPQSQGSSGRAESAIDELSHDLPCDFLVFDDRGWDPSDVLVPVAGGPNSDLSAAIAGALSSQYGSRIRLLHVDGGDEAEASLRAWAADHDLDDAEIVVKSGDVETAIEREAENATLIVIGATERGVISRLFQETLTLEVLHDVDCSVIVTERAHHRSLFERFLGRGKADGLHVEDSDE
jgi:nucleotide-binding universal stress UspA family protein